jgi:hypothetical protein
VPAVSTVADSLSRAVATDPDLCGEFAAPDVAMPHAEDNKPTNMTAIAINLRFTFDLHTLTVVERQIVTQSPYLD